MTPYYADGKPRSRHTYNYIKYIPSIDKFCSLGSAAMYIQSGNTYSVDCFDFDTKTWANYGTGLLAEPGGTSALDPTTGHIWTHGMMGSRLAEYIPTTNTWIRHGDAWSDAFYGPQYTSEIDPIERKYVAFSRENYITWDMTLTGVAAGVTHTGIPAQIASGTQNP